jgi:monofunctional biosynthetic peptidoglycan transglycosylase
MIEKLWSKQRILETYLNIAETGKGIFGVQSAAQTFFNKDAKNLSQSEAAMIAASLPNPKIFTVKPMSNYVSRRYKSIIAQMNNLDGDEGIDAIVK